MRTFGQPQAGATLHALHVAGWDGTRAEHQRGAPAAQGVPLSSAWRARDAGQPDLQLLDTRAPSKDALTVVVQHSPAFFDKADVVQRMANQRFSLCLAGHTHGGQLAIDGWAPFTPVGSGRFVAGFYVVPGCPLFVSRGAGTSVLPLRLGARAEVVVFDL